MDEQNVPAPKPAVEERLWGGFAPLPVDDDLLSYNIETTVVEHADPDELEVSLSTFQRLLVQLIGRNDPRAHRLHRRLVHRALECQRNLLILRKRC